MNNHHSGRLIHNHPKPRSLILPVISTTKRLGSLDRNVKRNMRSLTERHMCQEEFDQARLKCDETQDRRSVNEKRKSVVLVKNKVPHIGVSARSRSIEVGQKNKAGTQGGQTKDTKDGEGRFGISGFVKGNPKQIIAGIERVQITQMDRGRIMEDRYRTIVDCCFLNILHGVVFYNESEPIIRCKFYVGTGNNQKLVDSSFTAREGFMREPFPSKSNLCWTQTPFKNLILCSPLINISTKTPDQMKAANPYNPYLKWLSSSPSDLKAKILSSKRFSCEDQSILDPLLKANVPLSCEFPTSKYPLFISNGLSGLRHICKKHLLFSTLSAYCSANSIPISSLVPKTYLVRGGSRDTDLNFILQSRRINPKAASNPLIIKPGENSNRGCGIMIATEPQDIKEFVGLIFEQMKGRVSTVVLQDYLAQPLLFKGRKFDIRCFGLVVKIHRTATFYWYSEGYARTSSFTYDGADLSDMKVHLTNEAVQVKGRACLNRLEELREGRAWKQGLLRRARGVLQELFFCFYLQQQVLRQRRSSSVQSEKLFILEKSRGGVQSRCASPREGNDELRNRV